MKLVGSGPESRIDFSRTLNQWLEGGSGAVKILVSHGDEDMLGEILRDLKIFVRRLGLPLHKHHLYDDIIQDTLIIVHRKWETLTALDERGRTGWACNAMFNVTRNTTRAELRQTQAWQRLVDTAFQNVEVKEYFDSANDDLIDVLTDALNEIGPLNKKLLVDHVWAGLSIRELAATNNLTETAVRHRLSRARQTARKSARFLEISENFPASMAQTPTQRTFTD